MGAIAKKKAAANSRRLSVVSPTNSSGGGVHAVERPTAPRLDEGRLAPLVERARLGDPSAFEEIVRVMQGPIRSFARRMMRDAHLGDDAAQEIFIRMWKGLRHHEPRGRFIAWSFTVARNTCIELLRREKRTPTPVESEDRPGLDESHSHVLRQVVNDALAALDEPYRSTFLLRETGLAYEELAETLDCPVGTIRSRLHEARRRLQTALQPILAGAE
ncbi:MAG: sigma-70 family RNA polymerase sigma factor [Actinomycetota bacterium]